MNMRGMKRKEIWKDVRSDGWNEGKNLGRGEYSSLSK